MQSIRVFIVVKHTQKSIEMNENASLKEKKIDAMTLHTNDTTTAAQ